MIRSFHLPCVLALCVSLASTRIFFAWYEESWVSTGWRFVGMVVAFEFGCGIGFSGVFMIVMTLCQAFAGISEICVVGVCQLRACYRVWKSGCRTRNGQALATAHR
jgi:hypothetical protein